MPQRYSEIRRGVRKAAEWSLAAAREQDLEKRRAMLVNAQEWAEWSSSNLKNAVAYIEKRLGR